MIKLLLKVPTGIFSILLTAVVLYLCLAPQPVKSPGFFSFPGADKVVHGIMFFALTAVYLFDYRKMKHLRPISGAVTVMIGIAAHTVISVGIAGRKQRHQPDDQQQQNQNGKGRVDARQLGPGILLDLARRQLRQVAGRHHNRSVRTTCALCACGRARSRLPV